MAGLWFIYERNWCIVKSNMPEMDWYFYIWWFRSVLHRQSRGKAYRGLEDEGFSELELEAKLFAIERCRNKLADFTAWDLVNFVDQKYYEITNTTKDKDTNFVRSIQSYRLDLRRWGFPFDSNSKRPYFEGHERPEIVAHRETLIKYFLEKKDHVYTISNDENRL